MMSLKFVVALIGLAAAGRAAEPLPELVCEGKVTARLPPSLGPSAEGFKFTPRGFFAGLWYVTYSSVNDSTPNLGFKNIQLNSVFDVEANITKDLTSYQVGDCEHIYTIYATDADRKDNDDFPLKEPGTNITHCQDMLAYGRDTNCHRYYVVYGRSPNTPGIVISSAVVNGPTPETFTAIQAALINLGNAYIADLANKLVQLPVDDARTGLPDFTCDAACLVNQNSPQGGCPYG